MMLAGLGSDFMLALRGLRKTPGFTAVVVVVMGLGIGANTVIFSVVNTILLRGMPFPEADRVVAVVPSDSDRGDDLSFPDLLDVATNTRTMSGLGAFAQSQAYLTLATEPERFESAYVTPSLFPALGIAPIHGRGFLPEEGHLGNQFGSVILSHRVWSQRLASDPNVIGRTLKMNGRVRTVVGVMPPDFRFPEAADFWIPLAFDPDEDTRGAAYLEVVGRLAPGATFEQARAEVATLGATIARDHPDSHRGWGLRVVRYHDKLTEDIRPAMAMLMLAVLFVLLIACANVANLMMARATARMRELGVRVALGASRARVARLLLCESLVIAVLGAGLGVLIAYWGVDVTLAAIPIDLPYWMHFGIDNATLSFTVGLAVASAVLFGLAPVLQTGSVNLSEVLKEGGLQSGASRTHGRARNALVVAEVALAIVLLAGSGLMVRSFMRMLEVKSGLQPDGVLTGRVTLPVAVYPSDSVRIAFFAEMLPRLAGLPGVEAIGAMGNPPLGNNSWTVTLTRQDDADRDRDDPPRAYFSPITPGAFEAISVPILQGRDFAPTDRLGAPRVAIINESAARRLWPGKEPIGRRFKLAQDSTWRTVVGVVADVRQMARNERLREIVYSPHAQSGNQTMTLLIRARGNPASLTPAVRAMLRARDTDLPFYDVATLRAALTRAVWEPRIYAGLMGSFALIALGIAVVGLYGVMAYRVAQRTREIGIRMALGAAHGVVLRMVIGDGLRLTVIGLGIGLAVAFALTRLMASMLFGVSASDPPTYAGVIVILVGSALLACWLPASRAARVDPMVALRHE